MNFDTKLLLMAEHETAHIPLEKVAEQYLHMGPLKARQAASRQDLPFPVFRGGSQKSPWLVDIADLAEWLDDERNKAIEHWEITRRSADV